MVLKKTSVTLLFFLSLFFIQSCERIPESERRSVLINQEETTRKLHDFRRWLWTCKSQNGGEQTSDRDVIGQKMESFIDLFHSRGLSNVEDFEVSQIRSSAFMWRESGVLISNLSSFPSFKNIECSNGVSGWKKAEVKGSSRAMDLVVLQMTLDDRMQLRNRWTSREDRPRMTENIYLLAASYPAQIDIQKITVQPQMTQMRTGIDSELILFSPVPSEVYRGGVLVDESFKVVGIAGWDQSRLWGTAISSSQIESTVTAVLSKGYIEYPFLGFQLRPEAQGGLFVKQVEIGSPAYRAGLRVNDLLVMWNGATMTTLADWTDPTIADIGRNFPLTYERAGKKIETQITVGGIR